MRWLVIINCSQHVWDMEAAGYIKFSSEERSGNVRWIGFVDPEHLAVELQARPGYERKYGERQANSNGEKKLHESDGGAL